MTGGATAIVHDAHHALEHALSNLDDFLIAQQSHGVHLSAGSGVTMAARHPGYSPLSRQAGRQRPESPPIAAGVAGDVFCHLVSRRSVQLRMLVP